MNRFVCIHGHFYQPPRENPWLDEVELQEAAHPYHDWNERINVECYARNAFARILDGNEKIVDIVNNYSRMSFNYGPTLLSWLEQKAPDAYAAILEADHLSQKNFSGHGSAMAQVYNHIIMPLANTRDKRTQVIWGIKDFEYRFRRKPEGMWLAETAVDLETLDIMAEHDIKFTVLAPHQAKEVRPFGQGGSWQNVQGQRVDPRCVYLCRLPSGRTINIFFYDGPLSQGVAFEGLLNNGEYFANRLTGGFNANDDLPQVVNIATDGESYGHHHKFGDMALAYCLHHIETHKSAELTIYAEFLEKFPAKYEVNIVENTSWSCSHGVERWRSNCGCHTGGQGGWHQLWRQPLRDALDSLRDELVKIYQQNIDAFVSDGWMLRDRYIELILDRSEENVQKFIKKYISRPLNEEENIRLLKLLEMQYNALLMYTSCGWFFSDISGIESVQILKYAARAIQLAHEVTGIDLEESFIKLLEKAVSNVPEYKDGGHIYKSWVKPSVVDLLRVGAHYAVSSLFEQYPSKLPMYCYTIKSEHYELKEAGRLRLALGYGWVHSNITREKAHICFTVLHLGDHNFIGGVDYFKPDAFEKMHKPLIDAFLESNVPDMIVLINQYFGARNYSLWDLFKQEQENVLNHVLHSTIEDMEHSFRQIYGYHYPLMQIKNDSRLPLPRMLTTVVEFILNRDLVSILESEEISIERMKTLVQEMKRWAFKRDQANFGFLASKRLSQLMQKLEEHPEDIVLMEKVTMALELLEQLNLDTDLWKAQNIYFSMARKIYPDILSQCHSDELAQRWVAWFERLGDILHVRYKASLTEGPAYI
jgi:alpha-amylase/alpha-mannosidase (GH57 family)